MDWQLVDGLNRPPPGVDDVWHLATNGKRRVHLCYDFSLRQYQRLADDEVDDYDVLKAQLLKRFRLTEGGYRKRFYRYTVKYIRGSENVVADYLSRSN